MRAMAFRFSTLIRNTSTSTNDDSKIITLIHKKNISTIGNNRVLLVIQW